MSSIVLAVATSKAAIGAVIGAVLTWLFLKRKDGKWAKHFEQYEGYAIAAIRLAEKMIPDNTESKGLQKLDWALKEFIKRYTKATGVQVDAVMAGKIESWLSCIHNALDLDGALD
jgi:type II secretory pathway component PulK